MEPQTVPSYMSVTCTRRTLRMPSFTRATHAQPSLSNFLKWDSNFGEPTHSCGTTDSDKIFQLPPKITEVCYLLEVSWQMCHAWITHWTVARAVLTMSRRRSTRDERTHGRDARKPLLARTRAYLAPREPAFGS